MNKNVVIVGIIVALVICAGLWVAANQNPNTENTDNPDTVSPSQAPVTSGENPEPGGIHDMPVEPAAAVARKDLASKLSVDEKSIVILQITNTEWTDGCLGLGGPAESCLQALVPGFKVEMLAQGKTYIYRTDKTGDAVRMETN